VLATLLNQLPAGCASAIRRSQGLAPMESPVLGGIERTG
jgi:hypothetical protein